MKADFQELDHDFSWIHREECWVCETFLNADLKVLRLFCGGIPEYYSGSQHKGCGSLRGSWTPTSSTSWTFYHNFKPWRCLLVYGVRYLTHPCHALQIHSHTKPNFVRLIQEPKPLHHIIWGNGESLWLPFKYFGSFSSIYQSFWWLGNWDHFTSHRKIFDRLFKPKTRGVSSTSIRLIKEEQKCKVNNPLWCLHIHHKVFFVKY